LDTDEKQIGLIRGLSRFIKPLSHNVYE